MPTPNLTACDVNMVLSTLPHFPGNQNSLLCKHLTVASEIKSFESQEEQLHLTYPCLLLLTEHI